MECENEEFGIKDKYCVFSSEMWYKLPISMNTGDLIPGSAGHTLLSSLSNNLFDV